MTIAEYLKRYDIDKHIAKIVEVYLSLIHICGNNTKCDNLIAIEMKKSDRDNDGKQSDRNGLCALTKDSYDDKWSYDGIVSVSYTHLDVYKRQVYSIMFIIL